MARIVLDPRAVADLRHHLEVEVRALLESLRFEQLVGHAQLGQPPREFLANGARRALDRRSAGDEVLGRVDRRAVERARSFRR